MIAKVVLNTLTLMRVKIGKVDKKELKGGNIMHIHTMDENYDYRMRRLVEKFVQDYEIEEFQRKNKQMKRLIITEEESIAKGV